VDALSEVQGGATAWADDFTADPLQNGWQVFGDASLFHWNPTNQDVEVTWDSTNVNSYLYHPLGTVLTSDDAFSLSFDLQLNDVMTFGGGNELAVGFFNLADATNADYNRTSTNSANFCEFDYFPANLYYDLDSIDATMKDNEPNYAGFYFFYDNQTLNPGVTYQVVLTHAAGATNVTGQVFTNGVLFTSLPFVVPGDIGYFRFDTLSISSYAGDGFGDDLLAHGTVDNFIVTLPPPPVQNLTGSFQGGQWQAQFLSRTNWTYALERSADLSSWTAVQTDIPGTGTNTTAIDMAPPDDKSFYRIRADRP
jgi:hypothetical protein